MRIKIVLTLIFLYYTTLSNAQILQKMDSLHDYCAICSNHEHLIITPPFWKTWWFVLCNAFVFFIIGFVIYKKRIQFIKKREQAKTKVQKRLAETLVKTKAKWMLVIKNTPFIYSLYDKQGLQIKAFDKTYTYNVRGRNLRKAEHRLSSPS